MKRKICEVEYEHKILPGLPYIVLVRRKPDRALGIRTENWRVYHVADSPAGAQRILELLKLQQGKAMVRR